MFCSYHHHLIHAPDSPVEIRRFEGDLWIVPKSWWGPPDPLHRRGSGVTADPAFIRFAQRRRGKPSGPAPAPGARLRA